MTKKLLNNKIIWLIIVFLILLFPIAIDKGPQTHYRSVVIGVGIDKQNDEYLFSTQIVEPKVNQGFSENLQVYSALAPNWLEAVQKLTTNLGKITGLSNTSVIVFSEEVAREGIMPFLDFMVRSSRLNDNPIVIITKNSAKQLLLDVSKIDSSFSLTLNSLSKYNGIELNSHFATMEDILNNYYSNSIATLVAEINENEKSEEGLVVDNKLSKSSSSDGEEQSQDSQSSTAGKTIENSGQTALFVKDKLIAVLSAEDVKGFGICKGATRGAFTLKNISDENLTNADVVLSVKQKQSLVEYRFDNNLPKVIYHLRFDVQIENIIQDNFDFNLMSSTKQYLTESVSNAFKNELKTEVSKSLNIAREFNADAFGIQEGFEKFRNREWNNYLSTLQDQSSAFQNINVFLDIQVKTMI